MATANIDLPNGTKVHVEGTTDEINKILAVCGAVATGAPSIGSGAHDAVSGSRKKKKGEQDDRTANKRRVSSGVMQHIRGLIDDEFFREKRSISGVQSRLEELGQIYPLTHLSTPLRRLVRNKELRRMREGKNWTYVNT